MKIIICGAGQVGWQIARHLSRERNDITLIDIRPELIRRAGEVLDVRGVTGFASHPDVLDRAGARDCDLIIAATHSDEVNMVTCQVAHTIFEVPRKIARLRSPAYLQAIWSDLYRTEHLPIDTVISPEREVASAVLQQLHAPSTFDAETFLDGQAQLMGLQLTADCPCLDTPLRQLGELFSSLRAVVVGVRREGRLFAPEPNDQLFAGDQIHVISHIDDVDRTLEVFGKSAARPRNVVLIGAGNVGLRVAQALEADRTRMRAMIIERDTARAEAAADALTRTIVLNGDGLASELVHEAGIPRTDAVLTLTDDDKTNILTAVRAKQAGAGMAIALVNDPSLIPLTAALDIDACINPRASTVSTILRHVRHGRVRDIYAIGDGEAEMIEAQVLATSPIAGVAIRDLDLPEGALIGMVRKRGQVLRPESGMRLEEGDLVCIFALSGDVAEVERMLQVAIDFF